MSFDRFNVFRLDLPLDATTFDSMIREDPSMRLLDVGSVAKDEAAAWKGLATAHAYHVSSAKDELPRPWFAAAPLLERCPELLVVSTYGAGYDTVDIDACTRAGVCVVNQAGSNAVAVVEHTLGMMLGLSKRISQCNLKLRRADRFARHDVVGIDLEGRTLGVIGIGHVGTRMARVGAAIGMQILAHDPLVPDDEIRRRGAEPCSLADLLARADVVSLHCPLDQRTRGMFGAAQFAAMKPGTLFITTARGGIHDEAALYDALKSGHLGGAGLDVWDVEPPPASHPLLSLDNVIATYHIAGVTLDARRRMASMAAEQILQAAAGGRPPQLVNPEVWPAYAKRFERVTGKAPTGR